MIICNDQNFYYVIVNGFIALKTKALNDVIKYIGGKDNERRTC